MYATVDKEDVVRQVQRLRNLEAGAPQVIKAAVIAHVKVGATGMAAMAPLFDHGDPHTRIVNDHYIEPGGMRASFGARMIKGTTQIEAKAGLGVAKSPASMGTQVVRGGKAAVTYGHWFILGTNVRKTGHKRVWSKRLKKHVVKPTGNPELNRGQVDPHSIVETGYQSVMPAADQAAYEAAEKKIRKLEQGKTG